MRPPNAYRHDNVGELVDEVVDVPYLLVQLPPGLLQLDLILGLVHRLPSRSLVPRRLRDVIRDVIGTDLDGVRPGSNHAAGASCDQPRQQAVAGAFGAREKTAFIYEQPGKKGRVGSISTNQPRKFMGAQYWH